MDWSMVSPELTPLDQIRLAEAELARQVTVARESADAALANAQAQAEERKLQAHETGRREGQLQYQQIIIEAEEEARELIARASSQAESLRRWGEHYMDAAVRRAVAIVIGCETEEDRA